MGQSRQLKAGEYRFATGTSAASLLEQVVVGRVVEYPVRLVEGWTVHQMLAALNAAPKLTRTLSGLPPREIMMRLGHPNVHPKAGFTPIPIIIPLANKTTRSWPRRLRKMRERLAREWEGREPGLPLKSPDEALILASIVEKETGRADERPLIAGVFINRLRKRMKLQTDPTVIYGMGTSFNGNLRLRDLKKTRRTTPTPAPVCRRRRSPCPAAMRYAQRCTRRRRARSISFPVATAAINSPRRWRNTTGLWFNTSSVASRNRFHPHLRNGKNSNK